ncbi:MAG: nucleotidyltransferase domain-containing protein [Propionibacteriaceae bacterium]|jgi:predicted nucleotidyltransferase|nr:nucleotidyltransferase domain-containing protein [Propionibacteriaceae bacterium]
MSLVDVYASARRAEAVASAQAHAALRAMVATGMGQREIADALGVSQPAVSQQLRTASKLAHLPPAEALEASAIVLKEVAAEAGFKNLAVFGSVARGESSQASDIDLLVQQPDGASLQDLSRLKRALEQVLGHEVDLLAYGALKPVIDDNIRREAVLL